MLHRLDADGCGRFRATAVLQSLPFFGSTQTGGAPEPTGDFWFSLNDAGCGQTWCTFVQPNEEEVNNGLPAFHP